MRNVVAILLVLAILVGGWAGAPVFACPGCQQGVENEEAALTGSFGNTALGYNLSVLFMMGMPFLLVGCFAAGCYRAVRKQRRLLQSQATSIRDPQNKSQPDLSSDHAQISREHSACPCG